jgi:hypothetical protein
MKTYELSKEEITLIRASLEFYKGHTDQWRTKEECAELKLKLKPTKVKHERWINVYHGDQTSVPHRTKELADELAQNNRIACIPIEWWEEED